MQIMLQFYSAIPTFY